MNTMDMEKMCGVKCFNVNCTHHKKFSAIFMDSKVKLNGCNLKNIEIDEEGNCANFDEIQQFVVTASKHFRGNRLTFCREKGCKADMREAGCGHDHR